MQTQHKIAPLNSRQYLILTLEIMARSVGPSLPYVLTNIRKSRARMLEKHGERLMPRQRELDNFLRPYLLPGTLDEVELPLAIRAAMQDKVDEAIEARKRVSRYVPEDVEVVHAQRVHGHRYIKNLKSSGVLSKNRQHLVVKDQ